MKRIRLLVVLGALALALPFGLTTAKATAAPVEMLRIEPEDFCA